MDPALRDVMQLMVAAVVLAFFGVFSLMGFGLAAWIIMQSDSSGCCCQREVTEEDEWYLGTAKRDVSMKYAAQEDHAVWLSRFANDASFHSKAVVVDDRRLPGMLESCLN